MNYAKLREIKKLYFGYEEISKILGITPQSARVCGNRYVKQGFLIRIKRNLYVLRERWETLEREEQFILANVAQVPSYISLMTAMGYYEVTTQIQREFIESVAIKRTAEIEVENTVFAYSKIDKNLYFDFSKKKGFFIASPEKAFLDSLYLSFLNRYSFDLTSIDFGKLDMSKIKRIAKRFPKKTQKILEKNEYIKKT